MRKVLFFFSLALFAGCSKEVQELRVYALSTDEVMQDWSVMVPDTSTSLSPERAASISQMFSETHTNSRGEAPEVKEVIPIYGKDGEPTMYVINLSEDHGYVVVSASKEVYPILAYSNEGSLNPNDKSLPSQILLEEYSDIIESEKEMTDEQRLKIASAWTSMNSERKDLRRESRSIPSTGKPQVFYDSLNRWNSQGGMEIYTLEDYKQTSEYQWMPEFVKQEIIQMVNSYGNFGYGSIETSTLVLRQTIEWEEGGFLLQTNWVQSNGFNDKIPFVMTSDMGYIQPPVGCAPVAAGQIMRYHEYPTKYTWSYMDNNVASDFSASFLYELGRDMGIQYDSSESKATMDNVKAAFTKYGYSYLYKAHVLSDVLSEIDAKRPVYMRGQTKGSNVGHAWVCDGYRKRSSNTNIRIMTIEYTSVNEMPEYMIEVYRKEISQSEDGPYLHLNWGMTGVSNGYFSDSAISITANGENLNFQENRQNLINLKPQK